MRSCLPLALFAALVAGQDVLTALEGNTALSSFRSLLQGNSDLVDQINAANHTLLAPNNDALTAAGDVDSTQLLYHVLRGSFPATTIPQGHSIVRTLADAQLPRDENQVAVLNKDPDNTVKVVQGLSNATVLSSSQNGLAVIHELDTVLSLPASLSATATAAGLNSFAVTVQNVLPGLLGSLEGIEGITVFAPINDAFANLVGLLSSIPTGTIGNVIANHVLNGTVVYSSSMRSNSLSISASGQPLYYIQNATGTFVRSRNSVVQILIPDVPIANGVVHVVSGILVDSNSNPAALASAQSSESAEEATQTASETGFISEALPTAGSTFPTPSSLKRRKVIDI